MRHRASDLMEACSKKWKQEVKRCQHSPMTPLSHQAHINWQRCCFREELFQTRASLQRSPFFKPLNKYKQHSYRLLRTREKREREKYMRWSPSCRYRSLMIVYFCSVWTGTSVWYLADSANAIETLSATKISIAVQISKHWNQEKVSIEFGLIWYQVSHSESECNLEKTVFHRTDLRLRSQSSRLRC